MSAEGDQLRNLTRNEKRFLSRRVCGWCEQGLDRPFCGAIWGSCGEEARIKRREECLKTYKPRGKHEGPT